MKNPNLIPKPFAQNGQKDEIPTGYKSDLPNQKATWDTGFPQITMMPVTAGGLPPSGRDFNGVFNQISDRLFRLSKLTWGQLKQQPRHALGFEKIARNAIKAGIPNHITEDVDFIDFRFNGLKPMVGYRRDSTFFIVWLDRRFNLYSHG